ncbi:hypothetical protein LIER_42364 [Lithospermum erythrorhizon]|uniref:Uncharacterized protein n=1 Tax=Lithospermum erythrorhizon TaxID=34254 RepID=A0AAV3RS90_LITER
MAGSSQNPFSHPFPSLQGALHEGCINIEAHISIPTPALANLQRRSAMSQSSDDFGPLDAVPLHSVIGPPADVPPIQDSQVPPPDISKGKGSKEPASLESVKAKTIPGSTDAFCMACPYRVPSSLFGCRGGSQLGVVEYHVQRHPQGPLTYLQVASPYYNFFIKKMDKVEPCWWYRLWFLGKGGFGEEVRAHWSLTNTTLHAEDSPKT